MDTDRLNYLYNRYQSENLNATEILEWQEAIADLSRDGELFEIIDADWYRNDLAAPPLERGEKSAIYGQIIVQFQQQRSIKKFRLWPRISIAAAVAAIIFSAGIWLYMANQEATDASQSAYLNDIAPGQQGATLTLSNGKHIKLSNALNGELGKEAGVSIIKTGEGKLVYSIKGTHVKNGNAINTLSTANGEVYDVILPDGSKVKLNASSSIRYPANFTSLKKRWVELEGEAYFQIAKDKLHPFVVQHGAQQVEVLGTHFNVSTYAGEPVITTLEEGSVKVSTPTNNALIIPGQQVINNGTALKVKDANLEEALAWKNGNFIFSGDDIEEVMRKLERWYDIEVVFEGKVTQEVFYANISRYKNISQVLKMLEKTKAVHFSIKGRRVVVME